MTAFAVAALGVAGFYAIYTDHAWEDFFITFRFSRNLVEGKGLVYQPGERVHGFTSPLGTLLPALCYWLTGARDYVPALWLFRAVSILAYAGGGVLLLLGLLQERRRLLLPGLFLALSYLTEIKAVAFTVNGMETGFLLLFLGWAVYLMQAAGPGRWVGRGLCWAGLMWTRPDGCVYVAALALAELAFPTHPRGRLLGAQLRSAALGAALYLPWVFWATHYYGSPVPHTVTAKALYRDNSWGTTLDERFLTRARVAFGPIYYNLPGWWSWIGTFSTVLVVACALYALLPVADRFGRRLSLVFAALGVYLLCVPNPFPWYLAPWAVCGLAVVASGVTYLGERRWQRMLAAGILTLVTGAVAAIFVVGTLEMKVQEQVIEKDNRKQIGLWLHDRVQPGEHVYAECIGYIGYFSDAAILDYPGLVSPSVVRALKAHRRLNFWLLVKALQPEWVVLRPGEYALMQRLYPAFDRTYRPVRHFDVRDELDAARAAYPLVPPHRYLKMDAEFTVFRKQPPADTDEAGPAG